MIIIPFGQFSFSGVSRGEPAFELPCNAVNLVLTNSLSSLKLDSSDLPRVCGCSTFLPLVHPTPRSIQASYPHTHFTNVRVPSIVCLEVVLSPFTSILQAQVFRGIEKRGSDFTYLGHTGYWADKSLNYSIAS